VTAALLKSLGLPVLGRHTLEVQAFDCAGNMGQSAVAFEIVLDGPAGSGVLTVTTTTTTGHDDQGKGDDKDGGDHDQDNNGHAGDSSSGTVTVVLTIPNVPTGSPLDPQSARDVVREHGGPPRSSTRARARARRARLSRPDGTTLTLTFKASDLAVSNSVGTHFELTGRFLSTTGPAFVAFANTSTTGGTGGSGGGDDDHGKGDDKGNGDDQGKGNGDDKGGG